MWRNGVNMRALPEGGFVFTAWEPATTLAALTVTQYLDGVLLAQQVGDAAYQRIYEAFPAARAGLECDGTVILRLD